MSSTWIFDPRYGYYEVRFGGTAKVLQSYFAVAFIVIWLCIVMPSVFLLSRLNELKILSKFGSFGSNGKESNTGKLMVWFNFHLLAEHP